MIKQLVTFGDSWPAGAELSAADCDNRFPELVAKNCGLSCLNLSQPATSIDHAVLEFLKVINGLQDKSSAVLFCLTAKERSLYFQNNQVNELHPHNTDTPSLTYYSHIYSEELGEYNRIKNVILVQELCEKYKIPLFFVCNWNRIPQHDMIQKHLFYHQSLVEILSIPNVEDDNNFFVTREKSPYIKPNYCHPNLVGHELIGSNLTSWIKKIL